MYAPENMDVNLKHKLDSVCQKLMEGRVDDSCSDDGHEEEELIRLETGIETHLINNEERWVMFPIRHQNLWNYYKQFEESFWTPENLSLLFESVGYPKNMNSKIQNSIKHILVFNALCHRIINDNGNICMDLFCKIQSSEARAVYGFQIVYEQFQHEVYMNMTKSWVDGKSETKGLISEITNSEIYIKKSKWCTENYHIPNVSFAKKLICMQIVKLIFNLGTALLDCYLLKEYELEMRNVTQSIELILTDCMRHVSFARHLYSNLKMKMKRKEIIYLLRSACALEIEFISTFIPIKHLGIDIESVESFVLGTARKCILEPLGLNPEMTFNLNPINENMSKILGIQKLQSVFDKFNRPTNMKTDSRISAREQLHELEIMRKQLQDAEISVDNNSIERRSIGTLVFDDDF